MKKRVTELVFTVNSHSMALASRSGIPKTKSAFIEQYSVGQPQPAKEALDNLKRVAHSLKQSIYGLVMEFTALSQTARINGETMLAVNAVVRQVLSSNIISHSTGGGRCEDNETNPAD